FWILLSGFWVSSFCSYRAPTVFSPIRGGAERGHRASDATIKRGLIGSSALKFIGSVMIALHLVLTRDAGFRVSLACASYSWCSQPQRCVSCCFSCWEQCWAEGPGRTSSSFATRKVSLSDCTQHYGDCREHDSGGNDDGEKPKQIRPAHVPRPIQSP